MADEGSIAIIGIGCRFPGGATAPDRLWTLLHGGSDAAVQALPEVDGFDARFFGISPPDATRIDPRDRLLLEVAWEALEDAGLATERLAGTCSGVIVGRAAPGAGDRGGASLLADHLDLRGPRRTVDTDGSPLAALNLACRALLAGECEIALAGEGGVVAVLKPLGRALDDGDPIRAVVRTESGGRVILEEPPDLPGDEEADAPNRAQLLTISARSPEALRDLAAAYRELVALPDAPPLVDLCAASAVRRTHHDHRLAVIGRSPGEFADHLGAFLAGETRADVISGRAPAGRRRKLAFVFAGMGPQWWAMGRQLLYTEPVFRAVIEACDTLIRRHDGWSLVEELTTDEARSRVADADFAQPVNFAFLAALSALLRSWGIEPDAVLGHSAGEISACCAAGILSLPEGVRVAYHHGRLQHVGTGKGRMLAAALSHADADRTIAPYGERLAIAAVNSPSSVTLTGETLALEELTRTLQERRISYRYLPVAVPYHSAAMDPIRQELLDSLADLELGPPSVPLVSEVTGRFANGIALDGPYWWRNIREPVLFADAIDELVGSGFDLFVELSPSPALAAAISECLVHRGVPGTVVSTLRRNKDDRTMLLRAAGTLYVAGRPPDWRRLHGRTGRRVELPLYAWQHERLPDLAATAV